MKLTNLKQLGAIAMCLVWAACSQPTSENHESPIDETATEETVKEETAVEQESALGQYEGLVGKWTVDAATAGAQIDLAFNEDGSFAQKMGPVDFQNGTWTIIDNEHINIVTPNTKAEGQKWRVSELTETSVNLTWNLERKPMTLPMTKVTE